MVTFSRLLGSYGKIITCIITCAGLERMNGFTFGDSLVEYRRNRVVLF